MLRLTHLHRSEESIPSLPAQIQLGGVDPSTSSLRFLGRKVSPTESEERWQLALQYVYLTRDGEECSGWAAGLSWPSATKAGVAVRLSCPVSLVNAKLRRPNVEDLFGLQSTAKRRWLGSYGMFRLV